MRAAAPPPAGQTSISIPKREIRRRYVRAAAAGAGVGTPGDGWPETTSGGGPSASGAMSAVPEATAVVDPAGLPSLVGRSGAIGEVELAGAGGATTSRVGRGARAGVPGGLGAPLPVRSMTRPSTQNSPHMATTAAATVQVRGRATGQAGERSPIRPRPM